MTDEPNLTQEDTSLEEGRASWLFEVTDLKQYRYCPRVVFYRYCLPRIRPVTYKMAEGIQAHQEEAGREARRSLQLYKLPAGERLPDIRLVDPDLRLHGRLDLVIALPNREHVQELIPVEYKWSTRKNFGPHFRLQLAGYAHLLETCWHVSVKRGFIYQPPLRQLTEVPITAPLRRQVKITIEQLHELVKSNATPDPPQQLAQCVNCEFRRFCNDVI
jgi:CRISPR-associated exonuclease Cas4